MNKIAQTQKEIKRVCDEVAAMLLQKNESYGDSIVNPVRIFSKASSEEQINVRLDDKLSRVMRGSEFPGDNDVDDLIGYLIMKKVEKRINAGPTPAVTPVSQPEREEPKYPGSPGSSISIETFPQPTSDVKLPPIAMSATERTPTGPELLG